ncbi:FAD-dependent oxidoreductase [Oceanispirochaeta crateris]|uniref:FAD-dependent oxidoreductase n=1 Tax=Oceanispirochaeta crateris TaxID=2518645 RepID=A0A5C1QHP5_9SPIO|nr:NAD(P)/FAD-dependent oxidoreductase [Oceanispirochaeta crateris]QEN07037.1 FAD-dependent oxidoreductase [Oceanispirochaeta crateris]
MGQKELDIKISCQYNKEDLERNIKEILKIKNFEYTILKKSLDSRRKDKIHWLIRLKVHSNEIRESKSKFLSPETSTLKVPKISVSKEVIIVGTGPAGIFSALYLQRAGFRVTLLERGKDVRQRVKDIEKLEEASVFTENSNYSFGEGGAGTFSDGKLTSRSKHIKKERHYILHEFVRYGAPEEILYLSHPHIGSDKLIPIAENMRHEFQELGGTIHFDCTLEDIQPKEGRLQSVITSQGEIQADLFILATGHSALDTFRMLIGRGVPYRAKNFALGFRMEHSQEMINRIQWGCPSLDGVKAAEYRLTSGAGTLPVYSFCMCPGGKIVPAAAFKESNIVNGMSLYNRDGFFANAALVAGISPALIKETPPSALESMEWLESLEQKFYRETGDYRAPSMTIADFLSSKATGSILPSSYAPGLSPSDLTRLLPESVISSLQEGLKDICRRMPGWENGQLLGLESKTSSPIQVIRDGKSGLCESFENLYICGEASGWSGGIISSASDGLKTAQALALLYQ